jgi:filamentous hemagglutinin family protein
MNPQSHSPSPGHSWTLWIGTALVSLQPSTLLAQSAGLNLTSGAAALHTTGSHTDIIAAHNAALHWQSFNIAPDQSVRFIQPSASSIAWNHIHGAQPSQIWGRLDANGVVVLVNPSGFHFGPDSHVSAAGLVVSTASPLPVESVAGPGWSFNGAPPQASIINYGSLSTPHGGSLHLIAQHIEQSGSLSAPGGTVGLHAAQEVLLSQRPDGRGLSSSVQLPAGTLLNSGKIEADAGSVALHARVVNQDGIVQANSVRERNGIIELVASDSIRLAPDSLLSARGDSAAPSSGGSISVKADASLLDSSGSRIDIRGGDAGGDGGFVELCAPEFPRLLSSIDGTAAPGFRGGELFIDPRDIVIGFSGSGSVGSGGTVGSGDGPAAGTLNLDVNSAFLGLSRIRLQATRDIQLAANTLWDLASSTGVSSPGSLLHLEAGNNITLDKGSRIDASPGWSVLLQAGRDFTTPDTVRSGIGNITLAGSAGIQAADGDVTLHAGNQVTVAGGFVRSIAGGDLDVLALAGNINTGTRARGFQFRPTGYVVDPDLGGISTARGGNVSLRAGGDIVSLLPVRGNSLPNAGSGAFGAEPGNVTVVAGGNVSGHFVLSNGTGNIQAGVNAGTESRLLALSLIAGGWNVTAGDSILLQEIRNPNGVFNNLGSTTSPFRHRFDYSDDAYAVLSAGNSVQLRGSALPRFNDAFSQGMAPIYPGRLEVSAGAGGITLGNDVLLFPSPLGHLSLTTTDGGSLTGPNDGTRILPVSLIMSDAGHRQYRSAGDFRVYDHAATPIHLNNPQPVQIDISGNIEGILFGIPKAAEISVGGNLINSRFEGQNLRDTDVTRIEVAGDIINRSEFTSIQLDTAPDWTVFDLDLLYPAPTSSVLGLNNRFHYDSATRTLTFRGRMDGEQRANLLSLSVRDFDPNGVPLFLPNGEPVTRNIQLLPTDIVEALYEQSQNVVAIPDTGYRLGGGGRFEFSARNLDLASSAGIVSYGPRANSALAQLFFRGADVSVQLSGNLAMAQSTISTLNGGSIDIAVNGAASVGEAGLLGFIEGARGIFTVGDSDVSVVARGDISLNGSRIATYDGGNVLVRSLEGNIDAGSGAAGVTPVEKIFVDPVTREVLTYIPYIPGSGILATTFPPPANSAFPPSVSTVGNITVETPRGNIVASSGGIVQVPLNGVGGTAGTVSLSAGTRDAAGKVIHVGNINASGSGVIGGTVKLEASGSIDGLVFARQNIDLAAQQGVNVTALAQGSVNVAAGGTVSGTLIGVGSVNAAGATVDAALLSQNVSASGNVASSQVGFSQGTAAAAASQSLQGDEPARTAAKPTEPSEEERERRVAAAPRLTRTVGRVTVILPSSTPRPSTSNPN